MFAAISLGKNSGRPEKYRFSWIPKVHEEHCIRNIEFKYNVMEDKKTRITIEYNSAMRKFSGYIIGILIFKIFYTACKTFRYRIIQYPDYGWNIAAELLSSWNVDQVIKVIVYSMGAIGYN